MARQPKYSPEVAKRICDAIAIGATYDLAAKYGGVSYELFRQWRERNVAFLAAVQEAEGRAAVGWLAKIERAANEGSWQAAAWKLERRYPQEYGRTVQDQRVHHSGSIIQDHTGTVTIQAVDYRQSIRVLEPTDDDVPRLEDKAS
jgi:transposase